MNGTKTLSYLILSVAIIYGLIMPTYGDMKYLMAENKKYEDSLNSIKEIDNKILELDTRINNIDPEIKEKVEIMLPSSLNFVKLTSDIDNLARSYGIAINNVSVLERNMNPDGGQANSLVPNTYNSAILSFSFVSNYNSFLNFIEQLESSLRIMDVRSVQIKPNVGSVYEFNVQYEIYWLPV